jgi:hypothetical protein
MKHKEVLVVVATIGYLWSVFATGLLLWLALLASQRDDWFAGAYFNKLGEGWIEVIMFGVFFVVLGVLSPWVIKMIYNIEDDLVVEATNR